MEPSAHLKHLIKPCSVRGRRIDGMGNLMQVRIPTQHASISHFHVLHDWYGREWHRAALSPADGYLALRLPRYSLGGRHLQVHNGATWGSDLFSRSSLSLRGRRSGLLTNVWRPPVASSISTHPSPLCPHVRKAAAHGNALLRNWRKNQNALLRTILKE